MTITKDMIKFRVWTGKTMLYDNFLIDWTGKIILLDERGYTTGFLEENYRVNYLTQIKADELAKIVKRADLIHNMSDLRPCNLLDKYKLCQHFLTH